MFVMDLNSYVIDINDIPNSSLDKLKISCYHIPNKLNEYYNLEQNTEYYIKYGSIFIRFAILIDNPELLAICCAKSHLRKVYDLLKLKEIYFSIHQNEIDNKKNNN